MLASEMLRLYRINLLSLFLTNPFIACLHGYIYSVIFVSVFKFVIYLLLYYKCVITRLTWQNNVCT